MTGRRGNDTGVSVGVAHSWSGGAATSIILDVTWTILWQDKPGAVGQ